MGPTTATAIPCSRRRAIVANSACSRVMAFLSDWLDERATGQPGTLNARPCEYQPQLATKIRREIFSEDNILSTASFWCSHEVTPPRMRTPTLTKGGQPLCDSCNPRKW